MPVPKRKRSRCRRDKRFANKGMVMHSITPCGNCQRPLIPHTLCSSCGFYKGAKITNTKAERAASRMSQLHTKRASRTQTNTTSQQEPAKGLPE
jgi:large subunit ribosomal protein L32